MSTDETPAWKKCHMRGGNWVNLDKLGPKPRVDRVIAVRIMEAELAEFDAQIAQLGINRNRALRIAAHRIGGTVRNVNQIAGAASRVRDPDYRAFDCMQAQLQPLFELAVCREDGMVRLEQAAEK